MKETLKDERQKPFWGETCTALGRHIALDSLDRIANLGRRLNASPRQSEGCRSAEAALRMDLGANPTPPLAAVILASANTSAARSASSFAAPPMSRARYFLIWSASDVDDVVAPTDAIGEDEAVAICALKRVWGGRQAQAKTLRPCRRAKKRLC